jgi:predicted transcriptional regulator
MSARAMASQKQKRAMGGIDQNRNMNNNVSTQPSQIRITIPQALKLLENKVVEIEKLVVNQNNVPNQAEILGKLVKHINDLEKRENESQEKIKCLEETLSNKNNEIENKLKLKNDLLDTHTKSLADLQILVNKISLKLLNE